MATCSYCNTTIIFGGKQVGDYRFCNDKCMAKGEVLVQAAKLPDSVVRPFIQTLHTGRCPKCQGPGPVDVFTSYSVWSALIVTNWKNTPHVSCRACGRKSQTQALLLSLVFGWWGFPWGLIMTPVQLLRNLHQLVAAREHQGPSPALERLARVLLASQMTASPPN